MFNFNSFRFKCNQIYDFKGGEHALISVKFHETDKKWQKRQNVLDLGLWLLFSEAPISSYNNHSVVKLVSKCLKSIIFLI